jgi:hypothetical protein
VGGQACILYGAAEFSRDIDIAILISSENIDNLKEVIGELEAQQIYFPDLSVDALQRGHACHFRCEREDLKGLRIDVMGVMRGVEPFPELWTRREEIELAGAGKIALIGLPDLVKSKKTQRDKDWPMIRRLIESDIYNAPEDPPEPRIRFWLAECRTTELLVSLAAKYRHIASSLVDARPLLQDVFEGRIPLINKQLREEEDKERELDRLYWLPLKAELEAWRHGKEMQRE